MKGYKMQLKQVQGKSKKTGKSYTAYQIVIGKFKSPLFFPSEIEIEYIQRHLRKSAHTEFQEQFDDDLDEASEDDEEDEDEDE